MTTLDDGFFETAAGQTIAGAHRYLSAANLLRYSGEWGPKLQTPVLHLLSHGIELLLKYPLLMATASPRDVAIKYGHDLMALWNDDQNQLLRSILLNRADEAWEEARLSGVWPNDSFDEDPRSVLLIALERLAYLHSRDSGFALRYVLTSDTVAPRPAFLLEVFGHVAEHGAMNPRSLVDAS